MRCSLMVRLVVAVAVVMVAMGCSTALGAGVWSAGAPIDPSIGAQSVSCASVSFCVAVGFTSGSGSAAVYNDGIWSEATLLDPDGQLFSVSCPSSSFCMAMDGSGHAFVYNGSAWGPAMSPSTDLTQVSCVSSSFCVAVGGSGQAASYNGTNWSVLADTGLGGARSVSCASESFCMAVGSAGGGPTSASIYKGSSWGAPTVMDSEFNAAVSAVSCGSPSFCVAVGNFGDEETYSAGTWSKPTQIGHEGFIGNISCPSESFCVALSAGGEAVRYNGSTWSSAGQAPETASNALACPNESFCVAVGGYGSTYDGSSWSAAVPVGGGGLTSVACTSASFCTAVDFHGRALTYDGSGWSAPTSIDGEGGLRAVSCPSASFCVAAGGRKHGYALTKSSGAWSTPGEIDPAGEVNAISCPTISFCMALTEHYVEKHELGYGLTYKDGVWSMPSEINIEDAPRSVSCASESFCVAVGRHEAVIYSSGSWGLPQQIYTEGNLQAVSCASSSFCVAVAEHFTGIGPPVEGQALIYNGLGWSAPAEIPRAPERGWFDVGSVSCASASFCMAGARFEGAAAIFENGAWGAWDSLEINGGFSSVSCPSASFCMVVNYAGQAFRYATPSSPVQQPTGSSPRGSGPSSPRGSGPATSSPRQRGNARINPKTGEITVEYDFPEAGEGEAYGEVGSRTLAASHGAAPPAESRQDKRCKRGQHGANKHGRKGKGCTANAHVRYGRKKLSIPAAGVYDVRVKPSGKVLAALKRGDTLDVRVVLVFTPAGTSAHIYKASTVRVRLARRRTKGR